MGLLNRVGRGIASAGEELEGRFDPLNWSSGRAAPVSSAITGAMIGGGLGGAVGEQSGNGLSGAGVGAGIGALGGGGMSLARAGLGALRAGARGMSDAGLLEEADQIARTILEMQRANPQQAFGILSRLKQEDSELYREVVMKLS